MYNFVEIKEKVVCVTVPEDALITFLESDLKLAFISPYCQINIFD